MTLSPRATRRIAAGALALSAFVWVLSAQTGQGLARDEIVYMQSGSRYAEWWLDVASFDGAVTEKRIAASFGGAPGGANNSEHPPLVKTMFGLSEKLLHDGLGWTSEVTGYRAPAALLWALLVWLVVSFAGRVWGWAEGVLAGALVCLIPRAFFHAQLAAFDAPMVTMWFAVVYCYWRALGCRKWVPWLALAFGCALATKHNAVLLPAALAPHYLWVAWRRHGTWRGWWRTRPSIGLALLVGGPLVFLALWPWLWFDTVAHLRAWLGFHMDHVHYNFEYLGDNWNAPPFPWHVPIVTTLYTVPAATLAAAVVGAALLARSARAGQSPDAERAPALLLFLSAGAAMGPFLLTSTPIFGGEKHWMPAFPTIAVFAAVGAVAAARAAARNFWPGLADAERIAVATVGGMLVLAAMLATLHAHPHALSHYNAVAGGAPGGADRGMNRQFWGVSARGALPWLRARPPGRVYSHDAYPAWGSYTRAGMLDTGHPDAGREYPGVAASTYALVIHEKHFNRHDYFVWKAYGTVQPAYVLRTDGVPIVSVYERP